MKLPGLKARVSFGLPGFSGFPTLRSRRHSSPGLKAWGFLTGFIKLVAYETLIQVHVDKQVLSQKSSQRYLKFPLTPSLSPTGRGEGRYGSIPRRGDKMLEENSQIFSIIYSDINHSKGRHSCPVSSTG